MQRHPNPREREKNACPSALSTTEPFTFEKSGLSRNFSPSPAPGMMTLQTTSTRMMMKRAGIRMLAHFSIPFLMPITTTTWVSRSIRSR